MNETTRSPQKHVPHHTDVLGFFRLRCLNFCWIWQSSHIDRTVTNKKPPSFFWIGAITLTGSIYPRVSHKIPPMSLVLFQRLFLFTSAQDATKDGRFVNRCIINIQCIVRKAQMSQISAIAGVLKTDLNLKRVFVHSQTSAAGNILYCHNPSLPSKWSHWNVLCHKSFVMFRTPEEWQASGHFKPAALSIWNQSKAHRSRDVDSKTPIHPPNTLPKGVKWYEGNYTRITHSLSKWCYWSIFFIDWLFLHGE